MLRKIMTAALAAALPALSATAQHEPWDMFVGVKAGASASKFTKNPGDYRIFPTGAVYMQAFVTKHLAIDIELGPGFYGARNCANAVDSETGEKTPADCELAFLNTDVLLKYYPVKFLGLYAGAQFGALIDAKLKYGGKSVDADDRFTRGDVSIPAGVEICIGGFTIDARYHYFPLKAGKDKSGTEFPWQSSNSAVSATLGWKFQAF